MSKMFIVQIGYSDFALTMSQAAALMAALEPLRKVVRPSWDSQYVFAEDGEPPITEMRLADVVEPAAPVQPFPEEPPAPPLQITHQPKLLAPADDMPF